MPPFLSEVTGTSFLYHPNKVVDRPIVSTFDIGWEIASRQFTIPPMVG